MVKNVTKDYFNKNVYDLTKVDDNGELKFLGNKPVKISHESRDNILSDPLGFVSNWSLISTINIYDCCEIKVPYHIWRISLMSHGCR